MSPSHRISRRAFGAAGAAAILPGALGGAPVLATTKPALITTPVLPLTVGVVPISAWSAIFLADGLGFFADAGLKVETVSTGNVREQLPALTRGQIHVGSGGVGSATFNAFRRGLDIAIVADQQSSGRTPKSTGNNAFVVRQDLWDSGAIRKPADLLGRKIYMQAGPGSSGHIVLIRWLQKHGLDPKKVEVVNMAIPDVFAALQNKVAEVGLQGGPLLVQGVERKLFQILSTHEEMHPRLQLAYILYWTGIDKLGPMAGERFMVAYLRGVRAYIDAFEHGANQNKVVEILARTTVVKDPAMHRRMQYAWANPNGEVDLESLKADAQLLQEQGLLQSVPEFARMANDKYRRFALDYLGPYRPPG